MQNSDGGAETRQSHFGSITGLVFLIGRFDKWTTTVMISKYKIKIRVQILNKIRPTYSTHTKFGNTTSVSALLTRRLTGQSVPLSFAITHV